MAELMKAPWSDWETVRLIGRGSFGTVYEIQRKLVDGETESAALKIITIPQNPGDVEEMYGEGYDDESITATFNSHLKSIVTEYSLMRKMDGSANIVNCKDIRYVQHDDGIGWDIYIRMELLTPLMKALPVDVAEDTVTQIGKDICNALVLCKKHEIVHRDIKPQNIFVSPNGDYKLGDFGIAKTVEKTMGGTKIGTYKYMAPEVYNNQPYGSGADIYSLGLVLYWLLNERRMPFMPPPPAKLKAGLDEEARHRRLSGEPLPPPAHGSDELKQIVLKACAYDPKDRFLSATEMLEALSKLNGGASAVAPIGVVDIDQGDDLTVGPVFDGGEKQNDSKADEQESEATVGPVFGKENVVENEDSSDAALPNNPFNDHDASQKKHSFWYIIAAAVVVIILIVCFFTVHIWTDANCIEAAKCELCGKIGDQALGHEWKAADCLNAKVCERCGQTEGTALEHHWVDATCTSPKICSTCGETEGAVGEHDWIAATKTAPQTCSVCGATTGTKILPTVTIDFSSCSGSTLPQYDSDGTTAMVSCTSWDTFDDSTVAVEIENAEGEKVSTSCFLIEWRENAVYITPTDALTSGIYHISFTSESEYANMFISYGYEGERYLLRTNVEWWEFYFKNQKNERFLAKTENAFTTYTNIQDGTYFASANEISGIEFSTDVNTDFFNNGKVIQFITQQYWFHGGTFVVVFEYEGWYLASDSSGEVYLTKELDEECYWNWLR